MDTPLPPIAHLAHNFLRVADFQHHQLFQRASFQLPQTVAAWNEFLDILVEQLAVTGDAPFLDLGDIVDRSVQATLNAIAYDTTWAIATWIEQFLRSYTSGAEARAQFVGAHPTRLISMTVYLAPLIRAHPTPPTLANIDAAIKDAVRGEIFAIYGVLLNVATKYADRLETVDEHIIKERRQDVVLA